MSGLPEGSSLVQLALIGWMILVVWIILSHSSKGD